MPVDPKDRQEILNILNTTTLYPKNIDKLALVLIKLIEEINKLYDEVEKLKDSKPGKGPKRKVKNNGTNKNRKIRTDVQKTSSSTKR